MYRHVGVDTHVTRSIDSIYDRTKQIMMAQSNRTCFLR